MLPRTKTNKLLFVLYSVAPPPPSRAAASFYPLLSRCRLWDDDSILFRFELTAVDVDSNSMWDEAMPTLLLFSGGIARERKTAADAAVE